MFVFSQNRMKILEQSGNTNVDVNCSNTTIMFVCAHTRDSFSPISPTLSLVLPKVSSC